jgi:hypothetical protein
MKKVNINVVKMGSIVNLSINGKLQKKTCKTPEEANTFFKAILKAKENPTDENLKTIRCLLSEKLRIAMLAGLEIDTDTNEIFLAGFNTPIPQTLVDVIEDYTKNKYPITAIINFWKLLMINPDKRVRETLFNFIKIHDFSITDAGYMIVYKAVDYKDRVKRDRTFEEYVSNQVLHVKKNWKCSPYKYGVYKIIATGEYGISKVSTFENWDEKEKGIELLGNLGDLFDALFGENKNEIQSHNVPVYTDKYTHTMTIMLGKPVFMERRDCNGDPAEDCSIGLHCGCTSYTNTYGHDCDAILVCYVNPMNVISVPKSECSKMRVSEYFPMAVATYKDKKIDVIEQKYFEDDYREYELTELNELIAKVQAEELPIEAAINSEPETRSLEEMMKILSTRLIDIE